MSLATRISTESDQVPATDTDDLIPFGTSRPIWDPFFGELNRPAAAIHATDKCRVARLCRSK
jgi:hypothetical protein